MPMSFNELLKDVRNELKMTQEQFAHEIGVSFSTLSRWENGHTTPILMARKSIINLCKEKGISAELISKLENT